MRVNGRSLDAAVFGTPADFGYPIGRGNAAAEDYGLYSSATLAADGKALMMTVQDAACTAVDQVRFEKMAAMMKEARGAKSTAPDIPAMVELAAMDYGISRKERSGVLDPLIRDGEFSLYALANAVTRAAQDVERYDRSTEMESIGYSMLAMSKAQWNRLQQPAPAKRKSA